MFSTSLPLFVPSQPPAQRTIICLGTPRGGTSMVAGAIAGLGVFMGDDLPVNIEDRMFNPDLAGGDGPAFIDQVKCTIARRSAAHAVWGWKYPRAARYLERVYECIPNPHFVAVFRDPIPAALRSARRPDVAQGSISAATHKTIQSRLRMEMENLALVYRLQKPTLMVSFEKAQANPETFLEELAEFVGLPVPRDMSALLRFMEPGTYKDISMLL